MMDMTPMGKPDTENPHVRFDELEVASAKPRRGYLRYKMRDLRVKGLLFGLLSVGLWAPGALAVANWTGGDGRWGDPDKWTPHMPALEGETADVVATASQTLTVDSSTAVQKLAFSIRNRDTVQTLLVSPGVLFTLDRMQASANEGKLIVSGGGEVSITNLPFSVGSNGGNIEIVVTGEGTSLVMPKPTSSGLYIGTGDLTHNATFRVTDHAKVVISNATCLGQHYDINTGGSATCPGGTLIVEDGAEFESVGTILAGRCAACSTTTKGAVVAVTNATLRCRSQIEIPSTWNSRMVGSNATVIANGLNFPGVGNVRSCQFAFDDSFLTGHVVQVLSHGRYNRGLVRGGTVIGASTIACANGGSWESEFTFTNAVLKSNDLRVGGGAASNNVVRAFDCTVGIANAMIVGYEDNQEGVAFPSKDARWEQVGGSLAVPTVVVGKGGTWACGIFMDHVDLTRVGSVYVGDVVNGNGRPLEPFATFANLTPELFAPNLFIVGCQSVYARAIVSNSTFTIGSSDDVMVGRSSGAVGNLLEIVDSEVTQRSGTRSLYVGRDGGTTNNVLRLVRSSYSLETGGSKGDIIVGYHAGAVSNRLELVASTFVYNRNWMSVGHEGGADGNAISLADGSTLKAGLNLNVGNGGTGCRLELLGRSLVKVTNLNLSHQAIGEFAGVSNVIEATSYTVADGTSFVFRPSAEAVGTPVLMLAHCLGYGPNRPLTVDLTGLNPGKYRLVVGKDLADPKTVPTTFDGLKRGWTAELLRTADGKELDVLVLKPGTCVVVR